MPQEQQKIEVICVCDTGGNVRPLRFRFEDQEHRLHVIGIQEIVYQKNTEYVGIESILFGCRAELEGKERLFELRYTIRSLKWVITRVLY